jgi:hypothetical protein
MLQLASTNQSLITYADINDANLSYFRTRKNDHESEIF